MSRQTLPLAQSSPRISWAQAYAQQLRERSKGRAELWPQDPLVTALQSIADDIEEHELAHSLEELTLSEAADETGYSYSAIQKMVRAGELENLGGKGSPRVRRGDLPKKPTSSSKGDGGPDLVGMILGNGEEF